MREVIYTLIAGIPDAVYFGYTLFCFCILVLHYLNKGWPLCKYLVVANTLVASVSLLYFVYRVILFQGAYSSAGLDEYEKFAFVNRVMGPYWFTYWIPFLVPLVFQLLWIRRIRYSYTAAISFGLLAFITSFQEEMVFWITFYCRDFLPTHWAMYPYGDIWGRLFQLLVFLYFFGIIYIILRNRLKADEQ